ncbi:MAG: hypothetical protein K5639_03525, partial [Eubacterium sp.]|nr:hypothetical protein [Eubacterium sp.]
MKLQMLLLVFLEGGVMKNRLLMIVILSMMVFSLAGCGASDKGNNSSLNGDTTKSKEEVSITIDQVPWEVKEEIEGSNRYADLVFSNNSKYTIVEFSVHFVEKESVTEEDRNLFVDEICEKYGYSKDGEDAQKLRNSKIEMTGTHYQYMNEDIAPG